MNVTDIDAIILCGGLGTRLKEVIKSSPKVMAEVGNQPFLNLLIEHLKVQGVERIILCTGYKADRVEEYYRKNDFGLIIDFSREEKPLGTGGGLKNAEEIIFSDSFIVLNGDSFLPLDISAFLNFHKKKNALASMAVSVVDDGKDYGGLELDERNHIIRFLEKEQTVGKKNVNAGVYCFKKEVLSLIPEGQKFSLEKELFPALVNQAFYGFCVKEEFFDIGTPQRYSKAKQYLRKEE